MPTGFRGLPSRKAFITVLVVAFLALTLFPNHYHLHHIAESAGHGGLTQGHAHAVVLHGHAVPDVSHAAGSHELGSGSEIALKSTTSKVLWAALFMAVMLFLPFFGRENGKIARPDNYRLPRFERLNTPPLRAPPGGFFS